MVSLVNESNNRSPPYKNVRFGYSIHSTVKPQKSTFNSYNLFFYRFVVIFNIKYQFLKIFHTKNINFDAIIGTRMNIKLGPGFYFIEDGYQDYDRCHAVNPRWLTLIDSKCCFRQVLIKNSTLRYRKDFFHDEFKGKTF